jgi:hypothetical protein
LPAPLPSQQPVPIPSLLPSAQPSLLPSPSQPPFQTLSPLYRPLHHSQLHCLLYPPLETPQHCCDLLPQPQALHPPRACFLSKLLRIAYLTA